MADGKSLETELYGKISLGRMESGINNDPKREMRLSSKPSGVDRFYLVSNEDYGDETVSALGSLVGIKHYVGICGGSTQNLYLLGRLLEKNDIERINLIDKERCQLDNLGKIVDIYNESEDDERYRASLVQHAGGPLNMIYANVNERKPKIRRDITIDMWMGLIEDYLNDKVKSKGKYFVYLSNALFSGWINENDSYEMLSKFVHNEKFEDGSTVFFYSVRKGDGIVLEKSGDRLMSPDGRVVCTPDKKELVYNDDGFFDRLKRALNIFKS